MSNKKRIIGIIAGVLVFVIAFVGGYLLSDKIFPGKNATNTDAVSLFDPENEELGEGELTIANSEYIYYCVSFLDSLCSSSFQYDYYYGEGYGLQFTGYDYKKGPDEQLYDGEEEIEGVENPTYLDYIEYSAKKQLSTVKAYVNYAKLNGIALSEDELSEIETAIENAKTSVSESGMSLDEYLKKYFGEGMTEEIYRKIVEEQFLINKIDGIKSEQFESKYTDSVLEEVYNENKSTYGVVTFRSYAFAAESKTDEDGSTTVSEEAMAASKAQAEKFMSSVTDEASFKKLAAESEMNKGNEESAKYLEDDTLTLAEDADFSTVEYETGDADFANWVFSQDRKNGETNMAEVKDFGYVVYMIVEPVHKIKTSYTYDVRHVLFQFPEEGTSGSGAIAADIMDTSEYDTVIDIDIDPLTTADPVLYSKAQDALIEYLEGECSEDSFAALARKYSSDGNAEQGGIYEAVTEGKMVAEFENWALEEGRKKGDVGIVETQFGYHIMYFIKKDIVQSWQSVIREDSVYNDVIAFSKELTDRYEVDIEGYEGTKETLDKLVEQNIEYYDSMMAGNTTAAE